MALLLQQYRFCFQSLEFFLIQLCGNIANTNLLNVEFTISQELEQGQVDGSFPAWILLECNAITSGSKHFATANCHQLTAFIFASHVIQHSSVIDKSIQFPSRVKKRILLKWPSCNCLALLSVTRLLWGDFLRFLADTYPVLRLLRASSTPFWLYLTMWACISG